MKTRHFDLANVYEKNCATSYMEHFMKECGKKNSNRVRLIEQGGGFAILPDTNCKEDICEKEFAKVFHLGEIPTATAPKSERITTILTYDDSDTMFVSLTADQLRLLEWLRENDCLCEYMNYIAIGSEKFEEI